jgi:pimeloyl-ACP methyl ester carboxylesterase
MATKYFEHRGGRLAYEDLGSGPLILLAPSLGDVRAEYRFLAPKLAEAGYRVVSLDLRGHGESSVDWPDYRVESVGEDFLALIRHLESGPATIIGTSLSAGAAAWAAAEAATQAHDLVQGLVLVGAFVRDTMPLWQTKLMFTPLFVKPWGPAVWGKYYRTLYPTDQPTDFEQYVDRLQSRMREPGRLAAVRGMMTASKAGVEARLGEIRQPVLVVMGTKDPDFPDPALEAEWIASQTGGQVRLIKGAGHYPQAEMPEQFIEAVLPFLAAIQKETVHVA